MSDEVQRARPKLAARVIQGTLALAASLGAFAWAVHGVDLDEVLKQLKGTDFSILIFFLVAQIPIHCVRVVRWALLVRPLGNISPRQIFAAASVGFPAAFFLPFRLGEFVRPVMLSRAGLPFAGVMASVVVERIADGVVNLILFFFFLTILPESAIIPPSLRTYSMLALIVFGGALVGLIVACLARRPALALVRRILTPISEPLAEKVLKLLSTFIDGVMVLRTPGRVAGFVTLSFVFWISNGLVTWVLAHSYIDTLPLIAGPFTMTIVVFAVMIPAGPAFAGTLEAGFKLGLAPFAVVSDSALVIAVAYHAVQIVMMASMAATGFLAAGRASKVAERNSPEG